MRKSIKKIIAILIASLILLSNLSFLNANVIILAKKSANNSEQTIIKKSEIEVPEVVTTKNNTSKTVELKENGVKK